MVNTDEIECLGDFAKVRKQLTSEIEHTEYKLNAESQLLMHQLTPSTFIQNLFSKISDRIVAWVDRKL